MMDDAEFSRLVAEGVRGVTANTATVAGSRHTEIYEGLVTADIR